MKYIGLLDCNNFFVSCERLFRPDLKNVPTVVLSGNDGCVVARSQEVKDMGIMMGVPYFQVKNELAKAGTAVFSSNFALYRDISNRVMTTLKKEVKQMEQYSVDEAFFELQTDNQENVLVQLKKIKTIVEKHVGIPVSVGAAKTKTIAKYASKIGKKNAGTTILSGKKWLRVTNELSVHEIWGIGAQTSRKMNELGIKTVRDLLQINKTQVANLFGISGLRLFEELSEKSVFLLGGKKDTQKSIMSTRSFNKTTTNLSILEDAVAYHVGKVAEELRTKKLRAGWISVVARTSRHGVWILHGGTKDISLEKPTNDTRILLKEALKLLSFIFEENMPYKKIGFTVGSFIDEDYTQLDFFSNNETLEEDDLIMPVIDKINKHFGRESILVGRQLREKDWEPTKKFVSPTYTTNWREIKEINI